MRLKEKAVVLVFAILCAAANIGCGSASPRSEGDGDEKTVAEANSCLNERTRQSMIRWGEFDPEKGVFRSYECSGNLDLKKLSRESFSEDYASSRLSGLQERIYCDMLNAAIKNFMKIQTLNSPGPIARYVEYIPAPGENAFRAVWNPRYRTVGSKEFREMYDSLMVLVPMQHQW